MIREIGAVIWAILYLTGCGRHDRYFIWSPSRSLEVNLNMLHKRSGCDLSCVLCLRRNYYEIWWYRSIIYLKELAIAPRVRFLLGIFDRHFHNRIIENFKWKILKIFFVCWFTKSTCKEAREIGWKWKRRREIVQYQINGEHYKILWWQFFQRCCY